MLELTDKIIVLKLLKRVKKIQNLDGTYWAQPPIKSSVQNKSLIIMAANTIILNERVGLWDIVSCNIEIRRQLKNEQKLKTGNYKAKPIGLPSQKSSIKIAVYKELCGFKLVCQSFVGIFISIKFVMDAKTGRSVLFNSRTALRR